MCPSAIGRPGAILLGAVEKDGSVAYEKVRTEIDQDFIDRARPDGPIETQFRFADTCVEHDCLQWDGSKCNVPRTVGRFLGSGEGTSKLKPCPIRTECRWFSQEGPSACRICPGVTTKTSANITLRRMFGSLPLQVVPAVTAFFGLGDLSPIALETDDADFAGAPGDISEPRHEQADARASVGATSI
ncbi:MAG TPA: hypothetical protein VGF97_17825 [Rhizomicrobium sp.]|jgi:hypothetical protein